MVAALLFGLVAFLYSYLQTPMYQSSVRLLLNQTNIAEIFDPLDGAVWAGQKERVLANEVEFATSENVRDAVWDKFETGHSASVTAVAVDEDNDVMVITARSPNAEEAALVAQIHADTYIEVRADKIRSDYLNSAGVIEEQLERAQTELAAVPDDATVQRDVLATEITALSAALSDLTITTNLGGRPVAEIIASAEEANRPFSPKTQRNVALGLVAGLLLGAAAAVAWDLLDRSVRTERDLEEISGLRNLAEIPELQSLGTGSKAGLVALGDVDPAASEAFRSLRALVEFARTSAPTQVILISGAAPEVGKTFIASNLAVSFALSGRSVVLIDGDLRNPNVNRMFATRNEPGLSDVLYGRALSEKCLVPVEETNSALQLIPAGAPEAYPAELLGSQAMANLLNELRAKNEIVIIDSPPLQMVSDGLLLARLADAVVVVADARRSDEETLRRSMTLLRNSGANVMGTVLNRVKRSFSSGVYGQNGSSMIGARAERGR